MRRNADAIGSGRTAQAARDARRAADRLDALAQDLESVRRAAVQPQLERLLAAEKQAALLQERLRSVAQSSQQAEAEKGMTDSPGWSTTRARRRTTAAGRRRAAHGDPVQPYGHLEPGRRDSRPAVLRPPVGYSDGVAAVILALQAKIQEIMLENALVDRDGPVPPRYKELVEDYYRVLSQDLR